MVLSMLIGGDAMAELNQPTAHNPLAEMHVSCFFRSMLMSSLKHPEVSLSGRYRTLVRVD
jgi:hypothetical protein